MADRDAVVALLAEHPVSAVFHTAGVAAVGTLADLDADTFASAVRAKVLGARHLDDLVPDAEAFVLFSSIAGVWGSGGQGAYAAGNAYLDALASHRRARGLAATSVAWGPWAGAGMAADPEAVDYLRRRGLGALSPSSALQALGHALDGGDTCVTVADVDWSRFGEAFTAVRPSPLLSGLVPAVAEPEVSDAFSALSPPEREEALLTLVCSAVGAVLGYSDAVDPNRSFNDLGFDSLTAVELRNRLVTATGVALPASAAFDYPTAADLARHLATQFGPVSGVDALMSELDALDSAFVASAPDGLTRVKVAVRLRAFLGRWADERAPATDEADLDDLSDEAMLAMIDQELGR
jgi:acyl carrier protein